MNLQQTELSRNGGLPILSLSLFWDASQKSYKCILPVARDRGHFTIQPRKQMVF